MSNKESLQTVFGKKIKGSSLLSKTVLHYEYHESFKEIKKKLREAQRRYKETKKVVAYNNHVLYNTSTTKKG